MTTTINISSEFSVLAVLGNLRTLDFIISKSAFGYMRAYKHDSKTFVAISQVDDKLHLRLARFAIEIGSVEIPVSDLDADTVLDVIKHYDTIKYSQIKEEKLAKQETFFHKVLQNLEK